MNFATLSRRMRTSWKPVAVMLCPMQDPKPPGQWMPGFDDTLQAWSAWCQGHRGACVDMGLSAHWLLVAVGDDAAPLWQHYYGVSQQDLLDDWVQRRVVVGQGQLHCAAPASLINGIQKVAAAHHVQLRWVGPWWVRALERHMVDQTDEPLGPRPWTVSEPGLSIHAVIDKPADKEIGFQLRQVWCEAADEIDQISLSAVLVSGQPWTMQEAA